MGLRRKESLVKLLCEGQLESSRRKSRAEFIINWYFCWSWRKLLKSYLLLAKRQEKGSKNCSLLRAKEYTGAFSLHERLILAGLSRQKVRNYVVQKDWFNNILLLINVLIHITSLKKLEDDHLLLKNKSLQV